MVYIHPDKLLELRSIDLLSYLKMSEPANLVRISRNVYCTREHDSLKISNGKWYWWSKGIGGVSALDYLIKVKGYSFLEAANMLLGENYGENKVYLSKEECADLPIVRFLGLTFGERYRQAGVVV